MSFSVPNTASEFILTGVPFLTLLLGLAFLVFPKRTLRVFGLQTVPGMPDAIAEGRSSFAAPYLVAGLGCLLLQHPLAPQPSLVFMLAAGWSVSAFGRILQMVLDQGGTRKRLHLRFSISAGLAAGLWFIAEMPVFRCLQLAGGACGTAYAGLGVWITLAAGLTLVLGLIALFGPALGLKILRLQARSNMLFSRGETRGTLSGFYVSIGGTVLLMPQPVDFLVLVLGALWLVTGIGRLVSMVVDRAWSRYNFVATLFELAVGGVVLGILFRAI